MHGIAREQAGRGNSAANVAGPTGDGSKGGASAGTGTRRGEVFEEWRINVVVSESSSFPISDVVSEATRQRKDQETTEAVRARVLFIAREAAASETKLPDRMDGLGPFPYDMTLDFDGKEVSKKKAPDSAISRGYSGLKSIARSFFG